MAFVSYSQNFEDVILWRAFKDISSGFYVDIGAQDPIAGSVSLAFYKRGWRGVHVEPTKKYSDLLRKYRFDEEVVQAAVGREAGVLSFFEFDGTGLSTANESIALRHAGSGFRFSSYEVPVITLSDLLEKFSGKEIHWLKIDVEGFEQAVLQGWGGCQVRPWVVCVESTEPMSRDENYSLWEGELVVRGYEFAYFDGLNRYYVSAEHPELLSLLRYPVSVFDEFLISLPLRNLLSVAVDRVARRSRWFNFLLSKFRSLR